MVRHVFATTLITHYLINLLRTYYLLLTTTHPKTEQRVGKSKCGSMALVTVS